MLVELTPKSRIFPIIFLSISFPNLKFSMAQSTCNFMQQFEHLDLKGMPTEPIPRNFTSVCKKFGQNDTNRITCCTMGIEFDMERFARRNLENSLNNQIILLKQFFQDFSENIKEHIRMALQISHYRLNGMFQKTYGPFYSSNAQIFNEFFSELDLHFYNLELELNFDKLLQNLFSKIYLAEFALMNPLRQITQKESICMLEMQKFLRPFGTIPKKIQLLFGRSLKAWKCLLKSLETSTNLLNKIILEKSSLSIECSAALTRMNQCHICAGQNPYVKPCLNYCVNVLKGCLSEIAEIDPQFNLFIGSLIRISSRLKNVNNPYNALLPIPVQISEAIMIFQENGSAYSSRILLRCFQPEIRTKRNLPEMAPSSIPTELLRNPGSSWNYFEGGMNKARHFHNSMSNFVDKLVRLKSFWTNIPDSMCQDGQMAVSSASDECWNGVETTKYRYRIVGNGVKRQKYNPEFQQNYKGVKDTFLSERIEFALLTKNLKFFYENGEENTDDIVIEGSALEDLSISADDEDFVVEASGLEKIEEDEKTNSPPKVSTVKIIRLTQQTLNASSFNRIPNSFFMYILLLFNLFLRFL